MSHPRRIHLINPFADPAGGSEWRAINLYEHLREQATVTLWHTGYASAFFLDRYPIRRLVTRTLSFPKRGTLVFVGVYWTLGLGRWLWIARPRRVVLIYNTHDPADLRDRLSLFKRTFNKPVELAYTSISTRAEAGIDGPVEPSLFDLERFKPPADALPDRPFTVGRMSRDDGSKHHPAEMAFYERLAAAGCLVRVMGASEQLRALPPRPGITFLPPCAEPPEQFLRGIDCFYFRTAPQWTEPLSRAISEAMACGIAVVVEQRVGNAQLIEHGRNGFLFDSEEEAFTTILALRDDADGRARIGAQARRTIEDFISHDARTRISRFYLR